MNKNNQKQQKAYSTGISKYWTIALILAVAAGITTIAAIKSSSINDNKIDNSVASAPETKKQLVTHLNDENFSSATNSGLVLVDFWATWCAPCRMQGPIVENIASETNGKVKVFKLDVDQNPQTSNKYSVMQIPTILIFNNGKLVEQFVGLQQKETLINALNKHIN